MSNRNKPFASNSTPAALVTLCGGCRHWKESPLTLGGAPLGRCAARPPSVCESPTSIGPLCAYPVTRQNTPACGLAEPK